MLEVGSHIKQLSQAYGIDARSVQSSTICWRY